MKTILSLSLVLVLVMVAIHHSSSTDVRKRYYDAWEANNDAGSNAESEPIRIGHQRHGAAHKYDPCENKPLWFLKSQARLGKLSPFYDCINEHRGE